MRQTRTAAELILLLYRSMVAVIWAAVVLAVVASIIELGGHREGQWLDGAVIFALAALATIGVFRRGRANWRRALVRPIPDRGLKAWLWRQPGWRLALIVWAFELTAVGLAVLGGLAAFAGNRELTPFLAVSLAVMVIGTAFTAVGQAAAWCVIRQRQAAAPFAAFL